MDVWGDAEAAQGYEIRAHLEGPYLRPTEIVPHPACSAHFWYRSENKHVFTLAVTSTGWDNVVAVVGLDLDYKPLLAEEMQSQLELHAANEDYFENGVLWLGNQSAVNPCFADHVMEHLSSSLIDFHDTCLTYRAVPSSLRVQGQDIVGDDTVALDLRVTTADPRISFTLIVKIAFEQRNPAYLAISRRAEAIAAQLSSFVHLS
jgi:hypothetical protein